MKEQGQDQAAYGNQRHQLELRVHHYHPWQNDSHNHQVDEVVVVVMSIKLLQEIRRLSQERRQEQSVKHERQRKKG